MFELFQLTKLFAREPNQYSKPDIFLVLISKYINSNLLEKIER